MNVDPEQFDEIAALIHSADSPVGIDAKKTHILIIQMLRDIQSKLDKIERRVNELEA